MSCENCHITKPIQRCSGSVMFETITPSAGAKVTVFVEKTATKRTQRQEWTLTTDGEVEIDMTDPSAYFFKSDSDYKIWVTQNDGSQLSMSDYLPITMGGTAKDCVIMRTVGAYDGGSLDVPELQTLELDS